MSTAHLPQNNLVVFTPNAGHGHLGIIYEAHHDHVKVFSFMHKKTFVVPNNHCLPFRYPEDYATMCREGYWAGMIVESTTGRRFAVHSGRLDLSMHDCELNLQLSPEPDTKPLWIPLTHVTPIGHTLV